MGMGRGRIDSYTQLFQVIFHQKVSLITQFAFLYEKAHGHFSGSVQYYLCILMVRGRTVAVSNSIIHS